MESARTRGWERYLPGLAVLRNYDRAWLRPDVMAGLTVTAYLVPQVMAYAQIAGLPPVVGLWGMLAPLALGLSGDSSLRAPMAWAVIGGLVTSTLLSLIVVPAAYTVLHDAGDWVARRFGKDSSGQAPHPG